MRLGALTAEMVQKAITIYQDLAYGTGGRPRRAIEPPAGGGVESLLAMFQKELVEPVPGFPCHRYSLRLGNRNYPFMKLMLQEHLVAGEFFFAVDTHDQMEIKPDYPDYEQWVAVQRFNREIKQKIEAQFQTAGLDTCAVVRKLVTESCGESQQPCRGLVLIVDDEEDLAAAVEALLNRRGFRTYRVTDGRAAVLAAQQLLPDLVLLDYELPELDGLQVLAKLRAEAATKQIPVLLNSAARVSLSDIKKADGFLAKPFPEALLYEMVDRVLRKREVPK
ncbi:MAG: response regulator [Planctomycetes bacterium]|jgi:two-component system phosphate regulon response regulator PhoB|nr:response regulator [Planctomycetota bacterium]MCC7065795.1 response regulator [Planctomycetota bacterium]